MSLAKVYRDINLIRPYAYWDYNSTEIPWGKTSNYVVVKKVGRGKYSDCYRGYCTRNGRECCVKLLKPVRVKKIKREVKILQNLTGGPHIIPLLDVIKHEETDIPAFVFPFIEGIDYLNYFTHFSLFDIKCIMFQLFEALDYAHSNGIIHRDVKPQNIIIQYTTKSLSESSSIEDDSQGRQTHLSYPELWLIDWGLAEFYHPGKEFNVRVASRYYKGPELLVNLQDYDYSLDLFSSGCLLGSLIFEKEPLFKGQDNNDQLVRITKVLGTDDFFSYLNKYNIELPSIFNDVITNFPKKPWPTFINEHNKSKCTPEALDLLTRLLQYDHQLRPTAKQAMAHPFFDDVRDLVESNTRMKFGDV